MTKYELSLTKDYVPSWTLVDAMRELFQNALDQETTVPDNTMFWEYHEDIQSFHIGNKLSILEPRTLLLGGTTKANDKSTIGKFGEGYKIATLVLTRLGKKVTFFNYGAREVWRARFSKSKKYGEEILVFEVDKAFPWKAVPNNNLTIVVEGITKEEVHDMQQCNLHMWAGYSYWQSNKGQILRSPELAGKMFVNGLYICTAKGFEDYGYNFKPEHIELDRDRKLITDFNLKWTTSEMWVGFDNEDEHWDYDAIDAAERLISKNAPDTEYLSYKSGRNKFIAVAEHTYDAFKHEHGDNAVPVTNNYELNQIPATHKAIIVSENYATVIKSAPEYKEPEHIVEKTLYDKVSEWADKYESQIETDAYTALMDILGEY